MARARDNGNADSSSTARRGLRSADAAGLDDAKAPSHPQSNGDQKIPRKRGRPPKQAKAPQAVPSSDQSSTASGAGGSSLEGGSNAGNSEDEQDEADDERPEAEAPSGGPTRRRGRQTGLSMSLGKTSLGKEQTGTKRSRSSDSDRSDGSGRLHKIPRTAKVELKADRKADLHTDEDIDDEDYAAVDLISESDEDEDHIQAEEEMLIIGAEEERLAWEAQKIGPGMFSAPDRSHRGQSVESFPGHTDEFFEEHFGRAKEPMVSGDSSDDYSGQESMLQDLSSSRSRQVRFALSENRYATPPEVDSDSTSPEDSLKYQTRLQPQDNNGPLTQKFHDIENEKHYVGRQDFSALGPISNQIEMENGGELDGYETDAGDTTDDEVFTPTTVNRPQLLLSLDSTPSRTSTRPRYASSLGRRAGQQDPSRCRGPVMGSWVADPTKAVAVVDSSGEHVIFYPPKQPPSADGSRTPGQSNGSNSVIEKINPFGDSDEDSSESSPNRTRPLDGGKSIYELFGGSPLGPPEAFYPFRTINANGEVEADAESACGKDSLNINEFVEFPDDSDSESDSPRDKIAADLEEENLKESQSSVVPTSHANLKHFDPSVIASFRRSQQRQKTSAQRAYSMAFSRKTRTSVMRKAVPALSGTLGKGIPGLSKAAGLKGAAIRREQARARRFV